MELFRLFPSVPYHTCDLHLGPALAVSTARHGTSHRGKCLSLIYPTEVWWEVTCSLPWAPASSGAEGKSLGGQHSEF